MSSNHRPVWHQYDIEADRLLHVSTIQGVRQYVWPYQIACKGWADFGSFLIAYEDAIVEHTLICGPADTALMARSIEFARAVRLR